jgi:hypothetical protein
MIRGLHVSLLTREASTKSANAAIAVLVITFLKSIVFVKSIIIGAIEDIEEGGFSTRFIPPGCGVEVKDRRAVIPQKKGTEMTSDLDLETTNWRFQPACECAETLAFPSFLPPLNINAKAIYTEDS